ncbi:Vegetative incompatibility protein HET-E-1, partial [Cercospora beticola]
MWFIDVETRKLKFFMSGNWISYAILSHTWNDEEVTHQEFRAGTAKGKKGYAKIMQTCDQAQKDGLKYAWVDTCCINKESSAELSEAINSMWRYYENADVCYAFLSDFWHEKVAKSRWSVRGWTLQELIAPEHVVFFDSAWSILGVKRCLSNSLRSITGIDRRVIVNPAWLSDPAHTIAKKMSWAAGRKTSYKEDRAYSLLGLFDIRMPLLYGEGEKAFIRLQEEIIKNSTDLSFLVH